MSESSDSNNLKNEEFKIVSYKRKTGKHITNIKPSPLDSCPEDFDKNIVLRRILEAKEDLLLSDFHSSITASIREGLQTLGHPTIKEIVCFGLGKFSECMISRYQFALLLCLRDIFSAEIYSYDPVFGHNEHTLLEEFKIKLLKENIEGKYKIKQNLSLFFLPHCPKQLSNNLLWANWGLELSKCMIISNSFNKILETNTKRVLVENSGYLLNISPYVTELAVINSFKYFDIFNDTAIHIFPIDKLSLISNDLWNECTEPNYKSDDVEFITNHIDSHLSFKS